jgi:hypothetical protein
MEIVKKFGPYLAVELLLPGGSLIAVSMFLYRNRKNLLRGASRFSTRPFDYSRNP